MFRSFFLLSLLIFLACSTPQPAPNSRTGILDYLSQYGGKRPRGVAEQSDLESDRSISSVSWQSPLKNMVVTSKFGERGNSFHEGVDLQAAVGTPVYAAADGEVIYAGSSIRGYGKMVVLKHRSGLYSIYAHNSLMKVKKGSQVRRSQFIARAGKSGHATGPHLHFEVRKGTVAVDPMKVLSVSRSTASTRLR